LEAEGALSSDSRPNRIYLDNAATSWPKPNAVYDAVDHYQRELGVAAGRSAYQTATAIARLVEQTRRSLAKHIAASDPRRVVFAFNGTDALNTAIHGLLRPADHVVTTVVEHNSVLRPLAELTQRIGIEVSYVTCDEVGVVDVAAIQSALRPTTRLVVISHASNVTGAIQPIVGIAELLSDHPALLLVDAAQSLGHVPIDVTCGIDLLASSGHKGLLGPLGTGVLYVGEQAEKRLNSFRQGGTGTLSENEHQPQSLPEKFESGNLNVVGIAGLLAGVQFVTERGLAALRTHEQALSNRLIAGLIRLENVTLYGPANTADRVGVVSFNLAANDPHEVATLLDATAGIEVRSGLHCAPRMHAALGTLALNGAVRVSVGPFNTTDDIDAVLDVIGKLS
jgi:cysteine desulfurase family protein